jgi:hypothetical protein
MYTFLESSLSGKNSLTSFENDLNAFFFVLSAILSQTLIGYESFLYISFKSSCLYVKFSFEILDHFSPDSFSNNEEFRMFFYIDKIKKLTLP